MFTSTFIVASVVLSKQKNHVLPTSCCMPMEHDFPSIVTYWEKN